MLSQNHKSKNSLTAIAREEFIEDISIPNLNTIVRLASNGGNLPSDRFMFGVRLQVEYRATNPASGNPTGQTASGQFGFLDNIAFEGFHRPRKNRERFIDLRGDDAREWNRLYTGRAPLATSSLSNSANATNDVRFTIEIPFVPLGVPLKDQMGFLLDVVNYDGVRMDLKIADDKSIFTGQSTAPTFTAYGSSTGSPRIRVTGLFSLDSARKFSGFVPPRVWRTTQEVQSGDIVNGANASRLLLPPKGYIVRAMMLKTGTKTGATATNNPYATVSNSILSNLKVNVGFNRPVRTYPDMPALQESFANRSLLSPSTGYGVIDFAQNGRLYEALNTSGLIAGPTGDVEFSLQADVAGASNQAAALITEELRNVPAGMIQS